MEAGWQLVVVVLAVVAAAFYAGRHVWKQTRVADPDFSATERAGCSHCPANRSDPAARDGG